MTDENDYNTFRITLKTKVVTNHVGYGGWKYTATPRGVARILADVYSKMEIFAIMVNG